MGQHPMKIQIAGGAATDTWVSILPTRHKATCRFDLTNENDSNIIQTANMNLVTTTTTVAL